MGRHLKWSLYVLAAVLCRGGASAQTVSFGSHDSERVVYEFTEMNSTPSGPVASDTSGSLYGTTQFGGLYHCNGQTCGTVFKLTRVGSHYLESAIHIFRGYEDGEFPSGGLVIGPGGTLYGTTVSGGEPAARALGAERRFRLGLCSRVPAFI